MREKPDYTALKEEINALKKEKKAVILAHYYQEEAIQDVADYVGDSLGLSIQAAKAKADIILFSGVYFMAETAKILNPSKKVLVPDLNAGCSLSQSCPPEAFKEFISKHPGHVVVSYINCSAEVKAMSDIICTSSNAAAIINSIPEDRSILFAPDKNLGKYLEKQTGRKLITWDGACIVHEAFSGDKLIKLMIELPGSKLIAHPESSEDILKMARFIGSTSEMINYVKHDNSSRYIVATEAGILHQMRKEAPYKELIAAPAIEDNACACSECAFMKVNTLEKVYNSLKNEQPVVEVQELIMKRANIALQKMLQLSEQKNSSSSRIIYEN